MRLQIKDEGFILVLFGSFSSIVEPVVVGYRKELFVNGCKRHVIKGCESYKKPIPV